MTNLNNELTERLNNRTIKQYKMATTAVINTFGLEMKTVEDALQNMINEGYMSKGDTVEDVLDFALTAVEGNQRIAAVKLTQWANA